MSSVSSVVLMMVMVTFSGIAFLLLHLLPIVHVRDQPECLHLWGGACFGMGGNLGSRNLGLCISSRSGFSYSLSLFANDPALEMDDHPCVWIDGSAVVNNLAHVTAAVTAKCSSRRGSLIMPLLDALVSPAKGASAVALVRF